MVPLPRSVPPRFDYHVLVSLRIFGTEETLHATSANLCKGGMLLWCPLAIEPGTMMGFATLEFAGECEAMWHKQDSDGSYLVGVRFASLGGPSRESLNRILYEEGAKHPLEAFADNASDSG